MISGLISAEKTESLWIGYALASRVLKDDLKLKIDTEVHWWGIYPVESCGDVFDMVSYELGKYEGSLPSFHLILQPRPGFWTGLMG
jgi:hypothetical protein